MKQLTRPMLGFKSFWAARCTIAGIEVMPAIRKGQLDTTPTGARTLVEQFYALAAQITKSDNFARLQLEVATEPSITTARAAPLRPDVDDQAGRRGVTDGVDAPQEHPVAPRRRRRPGDDGSRPK